MTTDSHLWARAQREYPLFAANLLRIVTKKGGKPEAFRMNRTQWVLHRAAERQREQTGRIRVLILKGRQTGISTYALGRGYWKVGQTSGYQAFILTHRQDATTALFRRLKRMHDSMPADVQPVVRQSNANELLFDRPEGSAFRVATAQNVHGEVGRGDTFQFLHGSEVAFWPQAADHFAGAMQALADQDGTECWLESTANGTTGPFYDEWIKAEKKQSGFLPCFLPWYWHEEYVASPPDHWMPPKVIAEYMAMHRLEPAQGYWLQLKNRQLGGTDDKIGIKLRQEYPACIVGNQKVGTQRAGLIAIEDVMPGDMVSTGLVQAATQAGVKPTVCVTTALGYELRCTPDHPLASAEQLGEWIQAADSLDRMVRLQSPAFAVSAPSVEWNPFPAVRSSIAVTPDFARLLGYFIGDGSWHDATFSIACNGKDQDVVADVASLITRFLGKPNIRTTGKKGGCTEVRTHAARLAEPLNAMGLIRPEKPHRVVRVPACIMAAPRETVREFLRGLFEADGFAADKGTRVSLFSKHQSFLREVQLLLLGFGITVRRTAERKINGFGREYTGAQLTLRAAEALAFVDRIGFVSARKSERIAKFAPTAKARGRLHMQDRVASIVSEGERMTYDISVPGLTAFDANGFLVHNTAAEAFVVTGGENALIEPELVLAARRNQELEPAWGAAWVIGVDIARGGEDQTRIVDRRGRVMGWKINEVVKNGRDLMPVTERVARLLNLNPDIRKAYIDITGIGAGVFDSLRAAGYAARVVGVNFGESASEDERFVNKRAEMWGRMEEWLRLPGGVKVPDDDIVTRHLCAPAKSYRLNGELQIEPKPDIKKRVGFSPDFGDAACLTFAESLPWEEPGRPPEVEAFERGVMEGLDDYGRLIGPENPYAYMGR